MKARVVFISASVACLLLAMVTPALAHRLDQYLQAATLNVASDRVVVRVRLTAGVAAAPTVISLIDANGDGILSSTEQRAYAEAARADLTLAIDGHELPLRLTSDSFPRVDEMREGLGDITLTFVAPLSPGAATTRMTFENRHQRPIAAYLVNTLVPDDPAIHILAQSRARDQSSYQLDLVDSGSGPVADAAGSFAREDNAALVRTYFWHGVHHILTGFDHLLFLAALVLGAGTLWDLVRVVTAFTIAHSITLTLAALGLVHLPNSLVEPLIAASIVFVAVQNVFWPGQSHGRSRLLVAFAFGLFHGLGFAGGLLEIMHQMPTATVLLAIFGFSLGVEAGNQMVLLPLFGALTIGRRLRAQPARTRAWMVQRAGSAAVSLAGLYYLCVALTGTT